jgi:hypothetical protein
VIVDARAGCTAGTLAGVLNRSGAATRYCVLGTFGATEGARAVRTVVAGAGGVEGKIEAFAAWKVPGGCTFVLTKTPLATAKAELPTTRAADTPLAARTARLRSMFDSL